MDGNDTMDGNSTSGNSTFVYTAERLTNEIFDVADKNGDNTITMKEMKKATQKNLNEAKKMKKEMDALFTKLDADGDKQLSRADL